MILSLAAAMVGVMSAKAQQNDAPKGNAIITVFGDGGVGFSDGSVDALGFNLERAYLGYQYQLNGNWKAKVVYDMGKGDDASLQRMGYVKNAEINYSNGPWGVNLGLTSTSQFGVQEKFWGYRYVYKSMMDQCKWGSSADLGLKVSYQAADWLSADLSVFNGEGYKKLQSDDQLQYALGLTMKPVDNVMIRLYGDSKTAKDTVAQHNIALFLGYKTKSFRLGAEYNLQLNHGNTEGRQLQGFSVYGAVALGERGELYARYDLGNSSAEDSWHYNQDGQMAIVGYSYQPNKIFSFSPNVRLMQAAGADNLSVYSCVSMKINL